MPLAGLAVPCNCPRSQNMKSIRPLVGALAVSLITAHALQAADPAKTAPKTAKRSGFVMSERERG